MADSEEMFDVRSCSRKSSLTVDEEEVIDEFVRQCNLEENLVEDVLYLEPPSTCRPDKRKVREEECLWNEVKSKEKKRRPFENNIQIYITCSEQLPKTFSLAKCLKDNGIKGIEKVKYVNPYKVRLDFKSEIYAEALVNCKAITDKGWHTQRAMEKNLSYGVIRDVDLELTENDIFNRIICPEHIQLVSAFRLNRRGASNNGWIPSESVRLCFRGDSVPEHVDVDGLRMRVYSYVFPVSQCSFCWQLGHTSKRCSSRKVVCPKCGGNHENCETTIFKCVNCRGTHMAMYKGCPAFIKEKKVRNIMAEFNVTYRKALTMYRSPSPLRQVEMNPFTAAPAPPSIVSFPPLKRKEVQSSATPSHRGILTYADVVQTDTVSQSHSKTTKKNLQTHSVSSARRSTKQIEDSAAFEFGSFGSYKAHDHTYSKQDSDSGKKSTDINWSALLDRLKEIIFLKDVSFQTKMKSVFKCCVEWVLSVAVENMSDWPVLKNVLELFMNYV